MRDIIKKLRDKYKAAQMEIEDLQHEHEFNKEDLLDGIRDQEKDLKFANKVIKIMLSENEMYKIRQKAQWDDNKSDWKIPLFYFNSAEKNIAFPNINAQCKVYLLMLIFNEQRGLTRARTRETYSLKGRLRTLMA